MTHFDPPKPTQSRERPPVCGHRKTDDPTSYRCNLYRGHPADVDHHQIGTPVWWPNERTEQ